MEKVYDQIWIKEVEKETEKAFLLSIYVRWSDKQFARSFWFPKSVCQVREGSKIWDVESWFTNRLCAQNVFHGYLMKLV